ncbi:glycosyltransferase family 4 protein [Halobacteriovorax sp.]|uniref:glycosyltransferase family 4 protein n=1 Tax=Halobacteriovorax sp. TaxID=2020862 RepID=UPI003AF2090B
MKKKILFVAYEFFPHGGGGEIASYKILKGLAEKGEYQIDILTTWDLNSGTKPQKIPGTNFITVPIWRKDLNNTGFIGMLMFCFMSLIPFIILTLKNKYDLIHFWAAIPTATLSFFNFRKTPYIITYGGADITGFAPGQFDRLHKILFPISKYLAKNARKCIAMSNCAANYAQNIYKLDECLTIYNAADESSKISQINNNGPLKLVSVARLIPWKKVNQAVEAVIECDNVTLDVIGPGPELENLKTIAGKQLDKTITFHGSIDNKEVYERLPDYDVFILPSTGDSFGIVFTEAMSCGLATIGANAGGVKEVIKDGYNGFLTEPDNVDSIITSIQKLEKNRKLLSEFKSNSIKRYNDFFTWDYPIKQYDTLYKKITRRDYETN